MFSSKAINNNRSRKRKDEEKEEEEGEEEEEEEEDQEEKKEVYVKRTLSYGFPLSRTEDDINSSFDSLN